MFIAHLPAGYLLTSKILASASRGYFPAICCGLLGSVLPDIDLLYFYLIDNRQNLHHTYWTHLPVFWAALILPVATFFYWRRQWLCLASSLMLFYGIVLHLLLDTLTGGIAWFYPLIKDYYILVSVPEKYAWWPLNFILHWTFLIEILLLVYSLHIYKKRRKL